MHLLAWSVLATVALTCIGLDLLITRRTPTTSSRAAVLASVAWTLVGLAFAPVVLLLLGSGEAGHYLSAFALEKTLSLDNVAMFAAVLGATTLASATAERVLTGGLLGALVLRIVFIAAGLAVVDAVHAVMLGFAAILVVSGVRMARLGASAPHTGTPRDTARKPWRWTPAMVRRRPALAALLAIVIVDIAFAADSILAAFAITRSAYAIVAANVFAVLGLRPLYAVLLNALDRFRYLRTGIGALLVIIGAELVVEQFATLPSWVTVTAVGGCLAMAVGASVGVDRGITLHRVDVRRLLRRTAISLAGGVLLIAGTAMLVLPGPGVLVIVAGLAVLATEYAWAQRPLNAMRDRLDRAKARLTNR